MGSISNRVHDANKVLHDNEAEYYEFLHFEIFNRYEQKRIISKLKKVDKLITDNQKKALDFGSGTGNVTGKLLELGYNVTAIDISYEMCNLLRKKFGSYVAEGRLQILNSKIEDVQFAESEFDLITCYSVLHHLPDYCQVLQNLTSFLKKGGVIYLDQEPSPFYWEEYEKNQIIKYLYRRTTRVLNHLTRFFYHRGKIPSIPSLNYSLSDFWTKKDHHIDHNQISHYFDKNNFDFYTREDFYFQYTGIWNLFFVFYRLVSKPDSSLWIGKK